MTAGRRLTSLGLAALLALAASLSASQTPVLTPIAGAGEQPAPPWRVALLPKQKKAATRFALVDIDGVRALRVEAIASYGNLVHDLDAAAAGARTLAWRWRVDREVTGANLASKSGDDTALKVCALYDLPLQRVPFLERQLLRAARAISAEPLPAATVCYVWDSAQTAGSMLPSPFTKRLRYLVLQGQGVPLGQWRAEQRDLNADFLRAFGDETQEVPPLIAVAVGADADNTASHSLGYVTALELRR